MWWMQFLCLPLHKASQVCKLICIFLQLAEIDYNNDIFLSLAQISYTNNVSV